MSKEHQEGYAGKHPESAVLNENLAAALKKEIKDGQISCAAAHNVAKTIAFAPADVGIALDLMEVRLIHCQLGLFGYAPEKRIVKKADQWDDIFPPVECSYDIKVEENDKQHETGRQVKNGGNTYI